MFGGNRGQGRKKRVMPMYVDPNPGTDPRHRFKGFRHVNPHYAGQRPYASSRLPPAAGITLRHRYGPGSRW